MGRYSRSPSSSNSRYSDRYSHRRRPESSKGREYSISSQRGMHEIRTRNQNARSSKGVARHAQGSRRMSPDQHRRHSYSRSLSSEMEDDRLKRRKSPPQYSRNARSSCRRPSASKASDSDASSAASYRNYHNGTIKSYKTAEVGDEARYRHRGNGNNIEGGAGRYHMGPNSSKEQWEAYLAWLENRNQQRAMADIDLGRIYRRSASLSPTAWGAGADGHRGSNALTTEEKIRGAKWDKKLKRIIRKEGLDTIQKRIGSSQHGDLEESHHQKKSRRNSSVEGESGRQENIRGSRSRDSSPERGRKDQFLPSSHFMGGKKGYVYQLGAMGLGYYVDKNGGTMRDDVSQRREKKVKRRKRKKERTHKHKGRRSEKHSSKHRRRSEKKGSSHRKNRSRSTSSSDSSDTSESSSDSISEIEERSVCPNTDTERVPANGHTRPNEEPAAPANVPESDSDDELPGPQPLGITVKLSNKIVDYGGALRPGEGEAIAQYVQEGKRIPRRGEVGLSAEEIEDFETLGYVMSGSRHRRMNAIRIRKENQVYSAEEQRALAMYNYEERANREATLITDLREMLKKQNETIFTEIIEEKQVLDSMQK